MQHGEILQMRVGISSEHACKNALVEPPCIYGCATRCLEYERCHVFIGCIILIVAGAAAKKLVEFFKMNPCATSKTVKPANEQRFVIDTLEGSDDRLHKLVVWQQRTT